MHRARGKNPARRGASWSLPKGSGGDGIEKSDRRFVLVGEIPDADARRHDHPRIGRVIKTEKVANLMQRHGLHGHPIEHFALLMMDGEDDAGVHDPPAVITRPASASADRRVEPVDPCDVNFGGRGIRHYLEADWELDGVPGPEGA